jgi:multiple sugar transport system ATP-binding protein
MPASAVLLKDHREDRALVAQDLYRPGTNSPSKKTAVSIRNVRKEYGTNVVLQGVDLDIHDGEFLAIVGPSGCGKSTILKLIAGLDQPTSGEIWIRERPSADLEPKDRDIAMVFQSYALYPHMTAGENISLPLRMRRLRRWQRLPGMLLLSPSTRRLLREIEREVGEIAKSLAIESLLSRKPSQLSGGQRQRVALARAMVRHPAVFLMDEPLSNLDAKLRIEMRSEITALHRRLGVAFIHVTHDQSEAMTMADRVAVMADGRLLQVAPPRELYSDPVDLTVARFIGTPTINCIPGALTTHDSVRVLGVDIASTICASPGTPVTACLRPEHTIIARAGEPGIDASVISVEDHGADLFIRLLVADKQELALRASPAISPDLRGDQPVRVRFPPEHMLYFDACGKRIRPIRKVPRS